MTVGTYNPDCYLALHGVMHNRDPMPPCDGRLIRAHLIPRQLIERELRAVHTRRAAAAKAREIIEDRRSWVLACGGPIGCGGHHGMLDQSRRLRLPRSAIPEATIALAEELDLMWWIQRTYA